MIDKPLCDLLSDLVQWLGREKGFQDAKVSSPFQIFGPLGILSKEFDGLDFSDGVPKIVVILGSKNRWRCLDQGTNLF